MRRGLPIGLAGVLALISGAALAAEPAPPGGFAPEPTGVVSLNLGVLWSGCSDAVDPDCGAWWGIGGFGHARLWMGNTSIQLDAFGEGVLQDEIDGINSAGIGVHASWMVSDILVGGFAGITSHGYMEFGQWWLGAEARKNWGDFTGYGQIAYVNGYDTSTPNDEPFVGWYARAVGQFFLSPDLKLQGELAVLTGQQYTDTPDTTWLAAFEAEKMIASSMSGFGSLEIFSSSEDAFFSPFYFLRAGIRVYFNVPTLQTHYQGAGANLDALDHMVYPTIWWH